MKKQLRLLVNISKYKSLTGENFFPEKETARKSCCNQKF